MEIELHDGTILDAPDDADPSVVAKQYLAKQELRANPSSGGPPARNSALPKSTMGQRAAAGGAALTTMATGALAGIPASVASLVARIGGGDHEVVKSGVQDALTYGGTPDSQRVLRTAGNEVANAIEPATTAIHNADVKLAGSGKAGEIASDIIRETVGTAGDVMGAYPAAGAGAGLTRSAVNTTRRVTGGLDRIAGRQATKIAREAAGGNRGAIEAALTSADRSLNAGQAAAGVNQPTWQALQEVAARQAKDPFYHEQGLTQASGRAKALEGVTPDLDAATATRAEASGPLYEQARKTHIPLTPELSAAIDRLPNGIVAAAREKARVDARPFTIRQEQPPPVSLEQWGTGANRPPPIPDKVSGETLHYIKLALDDAAKVRPNGTAADDAMTRAAADFKPVYLKALERGLPIYQEARLTHAALSPPVNQSQVLGEVSATLRNSAGGTERVGPLLTQLDKSPERILKRATGQARATELGEVLTDKQMSVIRDVTGQLLRDENISAQAKAGAGGLSRIMNENTSKWRIPALFSPKVTVMNKGLSVAEASISRRVVDRLVEGMKNGESAKALLAGMSPMEKSKLLEFLSVTPKNLAASAASTAASEQN